ncbi:MAG: glycosyltransferase family 39 protein, partial [Deltaproteobacteria bacterium]|nr:glycosyltransferase family 39 protein [Deltaproteobacteria bacterium]
MRTRLIRYGLLAVMLLALVPMKASLDFGLGRRSNDASYYYTIARHVASGDGLRSNVSLYFQGFRSFPHRVTTSPGWPLALGGAGALLGIDRVAHSLPIALFFADLLLLYGLALRLRRGIAGDRPGWMFRDGWVPDFGHLAVFLLATNVVFFRFTSVPNNEPLGYALLFGALIGVDRAARGRSLGWAGAAGVLSGIALLTRPQLVPLVFAVPFVLLWVGIGDRERRPLASVATAGVLVPLVPWALYLASWDALGPGAFLGLEALRETPSLGEFAHTTQGPSWAWFVLDRLGGLGVAFDPRSPMSYVSHFGALAYAVPLAGGLFGGRLLLRRHRPSVALAPDHALPVAMVLVGVGALLPIHFFHATIYRPWVFGFRHGLPLLLLILPALAYLDSHSDRVWRAAAALLVAATLWMNGSAMRTLLSTPIGSGLAPPEQRMIAWLDRQDPRPTAITTRPWPYGAFGRSGFHWIVCDADPEDTLRLLHEVGADYVIASGRELQCGFLRGVYPDRLRVAKRFGKKLHVLELRDLEP